MIIRILFIVLLTGYCAAQTPKEATVRVYVYNNKDKYPDNMGSGVMVSKNQILTNYHVVRHRRKGDNNIAIRFADGTRTWATVEAEDKVLDAALVRINPHSTFKPLPMGTEAIYGDVVATYGFTYDYEYKEQFGVASIRRQLKCWQKSRFDSKFHPEGDWFQIDFVERVPGDSGGPVVLGGKLVGLINSIGPGVTVAVRLDKILEKFGDKIGNSKSRFK